jgi:hypothetical protein
LPQPAPEPDDSGAPGRPITGPLDMIREAQELIRNGSELVDRSKGLLDAAEREGKITVDVLLPKLQTPVTQQTPSVSCSGGTCRLVPQDQAESQQTETEPMPKLQAAAPVCRAGSCRRRLFRRWYR